ncbi:hypothetical protein [Arcanobacterium haemolyticum]
MRKNTGVSVADIARAGHSVINAPQRFYYSRSENSERYLALPQGADSFGIMDEFGSAPELIDLEEAGIQQRNLALWRIADGHVVHVLTLRGTYN